MPSKGGRRKRADVAFESFDGAGCSAGLELELAEQNASRYAGVFPTTSGRWQATVRLERGGKRTRHNVGSFDTAHEAAVQRALALRGNISVASPARRADRGAGVRIYTCIRHMSHALPVRLRLTAMRLPCNCHATAMRLPCDCHVTAM